MRLHGAVRPRAFALWCLLAGPAGCDGPTPPAEPVPAHVVMLDVGQPFGRPGARAPLPVEAVVTGPDGRPLAGVPVRWRAWNGRIASGETRTDSLGTVEARFHLGAIAGPSIASVIVQGRDSAQVEFQVRDEPPDLIPLGLPLPISVPTADGSGETVHPDYATTPFGMPDQLAITPYPRGKSNREWPSVFASLGGVDWGLAPGAPNPVVDAPAAGYLSDPDLLYHGGTGELWLYYRWVNSENVILVKRSLDGVSWSDPDTVVRAANHRAVSPTVVRRRPDDWFMYVVNAGEQGCGATFTTVDLRRSSDGIHWSEPTPVALDAGEWYPWHLDVQWVPELGQFWALYNAKGTGSCATPVLYLATSEDGLTWTRAPAPVLVRGAFPEFADVVYRSTFKYDRRRDEAWFWYSGARFMRGRWVWSTLQQRRTRRELFAAPASVAAGPITVSRHRLNDWP